MNNQQKKRQPTKPSADPEKFDEQNPKSPNANPEKLDSSETENRFKKGKNRLKSK